MVKKRKVKRLVSAEKSAEAEPSAERLSFEGALERLESIVRRLEGGQLPLAEALEQYETGVRHLKTCYQLLERAERRIELLSRVDDEGNLEVQTFDESATLGPDGRKRGSVRQIETRGRSKSPPSSEIDDSQQLF